MPAKPRFRKSKTLPKQQPSKTADVAAETPANASAQPEDQPQTQPATQPASPETQAASPAVQPAPTITPTVGRIPIQDVAPLVDHGLRPVKAAVGEPFAVSALVFREGHDQLGCEVVLTGPDGTRRAPARMSPVEGEVDRWSATVTLDQVGAWTYEVQSWSDPLGTWLHDAGLKVRAGVDAELMLTEGVLLLRQLGETRDVVRETIATLEDTDQPAEARMAAAEASELAELFAAEPLRELLTTAGPYPVFADRERALFSSWYEFFPRSEGARVEPDGTVVSGTLRTAAERLPAVAAMGFDVIYLPPIHPIGEVNRKGRNNTLDPLPADVGSPWAIGSKDGGHDAIHPDLGTLEDFDAFVARAAELGLEVALDFALQAAPDHPWASEQPNWFTIRADGSIAYAENPPKKYQDIYPINFDRDPDGIYAEAERVLRHWMDRGVRIFRVDNPHTKPVRFWEWLLGRIRATDPDVLFLSEAFTKPPMMQALAGVGFHQSYTYFTWRNTRTELEAYLREVSRETAHVLRPNFFVNTPDILPTFLQHGGEPAFRIRAALAATGSPSWGVYAGYELYENTVVRPGAEEYLDSEKFQIRIRDWQAADRNGRTLAPYLTRLNEIRRAHPALQQLRDLQVHSSDDDAVLVFSKTRQTESGTDRVIVVVNLDPHAPRETMVHLDLPALGLRWEDTFTVRDEITGAQWHWGAHNYVRLDPWTEPAHVLSVELK